MNQLTENIKQVYTPRSGGLSMAGRIHSRNKCRNCGSDYTERYVDRALDLYCNCGRTPRTYCLYLYVKGIGNKKIYKDGRQRITSYAQADRLLTTIRKQIDDNVFDINDYLPKSLKHYSARNLIVKWYRSKCKRGNAPTTRKDYRGFIINYFSPFAIKTKFDDCRNIRTHHIDSFYESLPYYLSPKTKDNIMNALKNFVSWLQRKEILERNPEFPYIDVPEPKKIWSKKSVALHGLEKVPDHDKPVIHFMLYHPLRSGEVCILRVKDINIEDGYIHVRRALSLGEERHRKNKKEYLCALSDHFDEKLLKHKFPEQYLFINSIGNHYTSNHLKKIWKAACNKANIDYIPLKYSGRTTIATEALNRGVPIEAVAGALGDSIEVTKKHYAHLTVESTRQVINDASQIVPKLENRKRKGLK